MTMKPFFGLSVAVLICVLALYGFRAYDVSGGVATNGKPLYDLHCASCHGPSALGDGNAPSALPKPASNLRKALSKPFGVDSVVINHIVLKGIPQNGMPAFRGVLKKSQVKDIFAYVRSLDQ